MSSVPPALTTPTFPLYYEHPIPQMFYVLLTVFREYSAYVTADDATSFRDVFREVVTDCVQQYQNEYGPLDPKLTDRITRDMELLDPIPVAELKGFSHDLKIDTNDCAGIISVEDVFLDKGAVISRYKPYIDELNQDIASENEKWAVFDGGFFPEHQGYEIDYLFK